MDHQGAAQPHDAALETSWLIYARQVVTDQEHLQACRAVGGSPSLPGEPAMPHPGVDALDVRWPGYLGARAESGSLVLVVGNVHRNFASGSVTTADRDRLVAATRSWARGDIADHEYLAANRAVYAKGLDGGWLVSRHLVPTLRDLNLGVDSIAYTNAARCQYPEVEPKLPGAAGTKTRLQRLCLARFPLSELAAMLRPRLILYSSVTAYEAATDVDAISGIAQACFHQYSGVLSRPLVLDGQQFAAGTPRSAWLTAVRNSI